jgi:hypothetical protein
MAKKPMFDQPREGDCDECGVAIPPDMIPSGFNRQTGVLLCHTCKRYHHQTPRQYFDE